MFDLAPFHIELAVRRLRFVAGAVRDPEHRVPFFVAALFGGMINVESNPDGHHLHLQQLIGDLKLLGHVDSLVISCGDNRVGRAGAL